MPLGLILLGAQFAFVIISAVFVIRWYRSPKDQYDIMLENIVKREAEEEKKAKEEKKAI